MQYILTQAEMDTRLSQQECDHLVKSAKVQAAKAILRFCRNIRPCLNSLTDKELAQVKRAAEAVWIHSGLSEADMQQAYNELGPEGPIPG